MFKCKKENEEKIHWPSNEEKIKIIKRNKNFIFIENKSLTFDQIDERPNEKYQRKEKIQRKVEKKERK